MIAASAVARIDDARVIRHEGVDQRTDGRRVAQLVIETAFADEEQELARISGHLCPSRLAAELAQVPADVAVYITHIKPGEEAAVMAEIAALGLPHRVSALAAGQVMAEAC